METTSLDSEQPASDLLSHVEVVVTCGVCQRRYSVPASIIRESQRILADGCSGTSLFECDASYYATLIEPQAIEDLERAWASFQQSATGHGGVAVGLLGSEANAPSDLDRSLERWENEGGRCEHVRAELAERRASSRSR